jgi:hypothetical protein
MKAMLKYGLDTGMNVIHIPGGLSSQSGGPHIAHQPGQTMPLQMWTLVDDTRPDVVEHIYVAVTGEALPEGPTYSLLGTVLIHGGAFVVHALYIKE